MQPDEILAIRESWGRIAPVADQVSERFYAHLFRDDARVREIFRGTDMLEQRRKLIAALSILVSSLDRPTELHPVLEALGRGHRGYGVLPEDYPKVGTALIEALREALGTAFTPAVLAAWQNAYDLISQVMLGGVVETGPFEPRD